MLHDRSGGATENLALEISVDDFAGNSADGTWTLHVVDGAAIDEGTITSWAVVVSKEG